MRLDLDQSIIGSGKGQPSSEWHISLSNIARRQPLLARRLLLKQSYARLKKPSSKQLGRHGQRCLRNQRLEQGVFLHRLQLTDILLPTLVDLSRNEQVPVEIANGDGRAQSWSPDSNIANLVTMLTASWAQRSLWR